MTEADKITDSLTFMQLPPALRIAEQAELFKNVEQEDVFVPLLVEWDMIGLEPLRHGTPGPCQRYLADLERSRRQNECAQEAQHKPPPLPVNEPKPIKERTSAYILPFPLFNTSYFIDGEGRLLDRDEVSTFVLASQELITKHKKYLAELRRSK